MYVVFLLLRFLLRWFDTASITLTSRLWGGQFMTESGVRFTIQVHFFDIIIIPWSLCRSDSFHVVPQAQYFKFQFLTIRPDFQSSSCIIIFAGFFSKLLFFVLLPCTQILYILDLLKLLTTCTFHKKEQIICFLQKKTLSNNIFRSCLTVCLISYVE